MTEPTDTVLFRNRFQCGSECIQEGFASSSFQFPEDRLHLAPRLFYGVEVGRVSGKELEFGTASVNDFPDLDIIVDAEVVPNNDIPWLEL